VHLFDYSRLKFTGNTNVAKATPCRAFRPRVPYQNLTYTPLHDITWTPFPHSFIAAGRGSYVFLFDERKSAREAGMGTCPSAINTIASRHNNLEIFTGGEDGVIRVWDLRMGLMVRESCPPIVPNAASPSILSLSLSLSSPHLGVCTGGRNAIVKLRKDGSERFPVVSSLPVVYEGRRVGRTRSSFLGDFVAGMGTVVGMLGLSSFLFLFFF